MSVFKITEQATNVIVTEDSQEVVISETVTGVQGPTGATGATGATGPQGPSGTISVTSPITNAGTSTAAQLGFDATGFIKTGQANTFTTGEQRINTGSDTNRGLAIYRNSASQSANLLEFLNSAGSAVIARVSGLGKLVSNGLQSTDITTAGIATTDASGNIGSVSLVPPANGGTGSTYGAVMVGRAALLATYTKAVNDTTPEAVFRNSSGTIQYFNVDADTTYQFEGWLQLTKTSTGATAALPVLSLIYVATGSTSTLTEQSARIQANVYTSTALIGTIGGSAANTSYTSNGTGSTGAATYFLYFRGHIRTNATTAGRINIGATQSVAGSSVGPDFVVGSYLSVSKLGSGNVATFGNWT